MDRAEEKAVLDAARVEADRWIAAVKFDGAGDPDHLAGRLHTWKFENEECLGVCVKNPNDLNAAILWGVAALRRLMGETSDAKPAEATELHERLFKQAKVQYPRLSLKGVQSLLGEKKNEDTARQLEPWDCVWDYYLFAFYESAYAGLKEKHPFISPLWFEVVSSGLGFMVNLGSLLVGLTLPEAYRDDRNRLHRRGAPAVIWDTEKRWCWHGIELPQEIIERPEEITAQQLVAESNQERKRAITEILGYPRVAELLGAKVVQKDDYGELLEGNDLGDDSGRKPRWGHVKDPSTGRMYMLRVPPETKTCREAMAATFGVKPADYEFDLET